MESYSGAERAKCSLCFNESRSCAAVFYFSARRLNPTLPSRSHIIYLSRATCMDWMNVATTVIRPYASGLLHVGIDERRFVRPLFQQPYISYVHESQLH
jgi:hypothetical protein